MMNNEKCPYFMCDKLKLEKENPLVLILKSPNVQTHPEGNTTLQTNGEGSALEQSDPKKEKKKLRCSTRKKSKEESAGKKSVTYASSSSISTKRGSKPSSDSLAIPNIEQKDDGIERSSDAGASSSDSEIKGTRRRRRQPSLSSKSRSSLSSCECSDTIKRKPENENKDSTHRISYYEGNDSQDAIRTCEGQGSKHKIKSHRKKRRKRRRKRGSCCGKMRNRLACCCIRCCLACCCIAPKNRGKLVACSSSCQSSTLPSSKRANRSRRERQSRTRRGKRGRSSSRSESSRGSRHSLVGCKSTKSERKSRNSCSGRGSKHSLGRSKCWTPKRKTRNSSSGSQCSGRSPTKAKSRKCSGDRTPKKVSGHCLLEKVKHRQASGSEACRRRLPKCESSDKEPAVRRQKSPRSRCVEGGERRPLRPPTCSRCANMSPRRATSESAERKPLRRSRSRSRSPCGRSPNAPSRPRSGRSTALRRRRQRLFRSPYAPGRSRDGVGEFRPGRKGRDPDDRPDQSRRMLLPVCSSAQLKALIKSVLPAINCPGCPMK